LALPVVCFTDGGMSGLNEQLVAENPSAHLQAIPPL
jgi:hypothetical protein